MLVNLLSLLANSFFPIVASALVIFLKVFLKPREWETYSKEFRVIWSGISLLVGVGVGLILGLTVSFPVGYAFYALIATLGLSLCTDLRWRMVRSDYLWILVIGSIPLWVLLDEMFLVVFVVIQIVGLAGLFFDFVGQSDSRAFILVNSVVFPVFGPEAMINGMIIMLFFVIIIALIVGVVKRSIKATLSLPVVPMLSASYLAALILSMAT